MSRVRAIRIPDRFEVAREAIEQHFRAIRGVLEGGFQWREQVRGTRDVTVDTDVLPVDIVTVLTQPPLAVLLLRAVVVNSPDGVVISGGAVEWEWRSGVVRIHAFDGLAASTKYVATISVME